MLASKTKFMILYNRSSEISLIRVVHEWIACSKKEPGLRCFQNRATPFFLLKVLITELEFSLKINHFYGPRFLIIRDFLLSAIFSVSITGITEALLYSKSQRTFDKKTSSEVGEIG